MGRNMATGLCLRGTTVSWTTLASDPRGISTLASGTHTLDETDARDAGQMGAGIRKHCPELTGAVSVALAPTGMLMRVMEFPAAMAADPVDLDDMVRLQMEKCSPFAEGRLQISCETIVSDAERIVMLVTGVHCDQVDFTGELCRAAGLKLVRIDAEAAARWRMIRDGLCELPADGARRMVFFIEPHQALMIALQAGIPRAFKALNTGFDLPPEEYADDLLQETHATALALDLEQGPAASTDVMIWHNGALPDNLRQALADRFGMDTPITDESGRPPLSAAVARRLLEPPFKPSVTPQGARAQLDFTPREWRTAASERLLRRRVAAAAAAVFFIWAAAAAVFIAGYRHASARVQNLETRLETLQAPAGEVRTLQQKVRSFEKSLARNRMALESLREVSRLLPPDTNITSFQFKRDRNVIMRGEAVSVNPIYDFKQALDESRMFERTEMGSVQPGRRRDVTVQTFNITGFFQEGGRTP